MGRRTITLVPAMQTVLKPGTGDDSVIWQQLDAKKSQTAQRHLHKKPLRPLKVGETVRIQPI
ncbi:hypothetical protein HOLleu_30843 [Holothuria leucospilota]|uniref:Uncharacterized protein n=1 Tax=Holothuria leucospilota TaxID=206669 RepID=A0A9Q1BL99_HOLLE|nr:hypothetical protein HOLleu_30843 [Holothuria leucospilota]